MSVNVTAQILNPFTRLALLDTRTASQYEASRYLYVATLGVSISSEYAARNCKLNVDFAQAFTWDWLTSMQQEVELVRHHHSLPTLAYFISRCAQSRLTPSRLSF
jgi:hypothetical protein